MIHTATDDEFFEAVIKQVKGNAEETLAERRQHRAEAAANHASIRKQLNVLVNNLTGLGVKAEDLSQVKSKMDSLKEQDQQLERRIRERDRDIHTLQYQQVDKKQLREVFRDFAALHSGAQPETKRRLLNVIIEEIRRSVKRRGTLSRVLFLIPEW